MGQGGGVGQEPDLSSVPGVRPPPPQVVGSPCANLFVAPTGETLLLSTHERVFVAPHRAVGSTFPQQSVPHAALAEATLSIGGGMQERGERGGVYLPAAVSVTCRPGRGYAQHRGVEGVRKEVGSRGR